MDADTIWRICFIVVLFIAKTGIAAGLCLGTSKPKMPTASGSSDKTKLLALAYFLQACSVHQAHACAGACVPACVHAVNASTTCQEALSRHLPRLPSAPQRTTS
eukprot:272350-Chlamydomonas_euryale.AAC.6